MIRYDILYEYAESKGLSYNELCAVVHDALVPANIKTALESPGCERIRDFYYVGPVQRAAVESFLIAVGPTEKLL